jgi:hypothetical protein
MSVFDYERRFCDLSMFASHYITIEQYMIKRLHDGLQ